MAGGNPGCNNIKPEVGITGTPVIDIGTDSAQPNVLYAVSAHYNTSTFQITQRLNAINVVTGAVISTIDVPTALGSGFQAAYQNQRAALALTYDTNNNPLIYVAWGSYCDIVPPTGTYAGWAAVFTLTGTTPALSLVASYNTMGTVSGASQGGIWMGGSGPTIDDQGSSMPGNVYLSTGNGTVNYATPLTNSALGTSILQLQTMVGSSSSLKAVGAYTPAEYSTLNTGSGTNCPTTGSLLLPPPYPQGPPVSWLCTGSDFDLDAGGVVLARGTGGLLPTGANFVVLAAGKEGVFYDINPLHMANTAPDPNPPCSQGSTIAIQCFGAIQLPLYDNSSSAPASEDTGSRCSSAFWSGLTFDENILYVSGSNHTDLRAYDMTSGGGFATTALGSYNFGATATKYPGGCPVVSWNSSGGTNAANDAVLWVLQTGGSNSAVPVGLYAFPALPAHGSFGATPLFTDTTNGPGAVKFTEPTVTNGYVFVAGQVNGTVCTTAPCSGQVVSWH